MAIFRDELFQAQWLRAAGHAVYGGADAGECLWAAAQIREVDAESWYGAWARLAERLDAAAQASLEGGHAASARSAWLRAANYRRAAYTFLIGGAPVDARVAEGWRRQRAAFAAAAALMTPAGEAVTIPYDGDALPGWFFPAAADGAPRPTLIVNGGYDSTAEEAWLFSGAAARERGYNVLTFDGPGQGGALIEDGRVFRPDWEAVIGPVVDWLAARNEVDPARIALMGVSFGGYLATRGASGEPRLAALIADPGEYDLAEELKGRLPGVVARALPDGHPLILGLIERMMRWRMRHLTQGWGLRRNLWVHGLASPLAYAQMAEAYTVKGRADRIACPTLVCQAENDEIGATARALFDALTCEKRFLAFRAADAAGEHCEAGARAWFNQQAFDWLDGVMAGATQGATIRRAA